jgi:hypothetical protein
MSRTTRRSRELDTVAEIAAVQGGFVLARQLAQLQVPGSTVASRARTGGPWARVLPAVYLVSPGPMTRQQREQAALLYAGDGSCLSGFAALRRYGVRYLPGAPDVDRVHVLVPHVRRRVSAGFVTAERTTRMPEAALVGGLPCAPVARALVDAARRLRSRSAVRAMTADAVHRELCTTAQLAVELAAAQIRGTALVRKTVTELNRGIRSAPEGTLRDLVTGSGLPEPLWNPTLLTPAGEFLGRPDAYYEEQALALEVNSNEHHRRNREDWERTLSRQARIASFGVLLLPFSPYRINHEPDGVAGDIADALRARQGVTPPRLVVVPAPE